MDFSFLLNFRYRIPADKGETIQIMSKSNFSHQYKKATLGIFKKLLFLKK